ncbi:hypothetical protein HYU13_00085 [Candidatus Woesearchaeota archaeon]|nr:hypothetical protein [Candidatus Woesearchaeota archaeon]
MNSGNIVIELSKRFGLSPEDYLSKTIAGLYLAKQGEKPVPFGLYRETSMPCDGKPGTISVENQEFLPHRVSEIALNTFFSHMQPQMPAGFLLAFFFTYEDCNLPEAYVDCNDGQLDMGLLFRPAVLGCNMSRIKPYSEVHLYTAEEDGEKIYAFYLEDIPTDKGDTCLAELIGEIERGCGEIESLIRPKD